MGVRAVRARRRPGAAGGGAAGWGELRAWERTAVLRVLR